MFRLTGLIVLVLTAAHPIQAEKLDLRYALAPGQQLFYVSESVSESYTVLSKADVWVLGETGDGRWDVLLRQTRQMIRQGGPLKEPDNLGLIRFTLSPDGAIPAGEGGDYQIDPRAFFPKMPSADEVQWEYNDPERGNTTRYTIKPEEAPGITLIDVQTQNVFNEIYGVTSEQTIHFDTARGLLARIDSKTKQTYGVNQEYLGTTRLEAVHELEASSLEALKRDVAVYLRAKETYGDAIRRAEASQDIQAGLDQARQVMASAKAGVTSSIIVDQLDQALGQHEQYKDYMVESAQRRAAVIGKPAADWTLNDLEGHGHALADYRGKVVILDFWYRGCGWCIRAMPQINRVAEHYEGQPVAVLGMNTDSVLDDAVFVQEKMKLRYPNLQARGIPEQYKVRGFPTLIIIDQAGVVRGVHVGFSQTLYEDVVDEADALLAAAPQ